jgi:hypothetical protein
MTPVRPLRVSFDRISSTRLPTRIAFLGGAGGAACGGTGGTFEAPVRLPSHSLLRFLAVAIAPLALPIAAPPLPVCLLGLPWRPIDLTLAVCALLSRQTLAATHIREAPCGPTPMGQIAVSP